MRDMRRGMWVLYKGQVGIFVTDEPRCRQCRNSVPRSAASCARCGAEAPQGQEFVEVHLVDAAGETSEVLMLEPDVQLEQAGLQGIPEVRRPDASDAQRLGYI